jgi:protein FAM32A
MAGDDYSVAGGGGLRLKGAKVKKHKKKKDKTAVADKVNELDKALSSSLSSSGGGARDAAGDDEKSRAALAVGSAGKNGGGDDGDRDHDQDQQPTRYKTEAERRFEEAKRKKVRSRQGTHSRG